MSRFIAVLAVAALAVVVVSAQDAAYQQGLSIHNQQIAEHLRKEQQHASSFPQPQQYQQPAPQQYNNHNQYNNNNYARSSDPQRDYEEGLRAHKAAIQEVLAKEAKFQPLNHLFGENNPAYQQGLQLHQRQLQEHLAAEQQHGGPVYPAQQQSYQQPAHYNPPPQTPQHYSNNQGPSVPYDSGLQQHMQQLLQHQRQEQEQQATTGQASQYHQSLERQQPYQPRQSSYQPRQNSYQPAQHGGRVSLANLGF